MPHCVKKSITKHTYTCSVNEVEKRTSCFFPLDSKGEDGSVWTSHLYKRMIQTGQPHLSGHIKQNAPHLLGEEWTIHVLHHAGHILLFVLALCASVCAGTLCLYTLLYHFVDKCGETVPKLRYCHEERITVKQEMDYRRWFLETSDIMGSAWIISAHSPAELVRN